MPEQYTLSTIYVFALCQWPAIGPLADFYFTPYAAA